MGEVEMARTRLAWDRDFHTVSDTDFATGTIAWFLGGTLNVAYNCVDRHLATRGDKTAILWEGDICCSQNSGHLPR